MNPILKIFISAIAATTFSLPFPLSNEQTIVPTALPLPSANFEVIDVSTGTIREASAFNSTPEQTDGNPCQAADGSDICARFAAGECLIAGNFAKLGSQHYIDGFGVCTLIDRMNSRYSQEVDIYFGMDVSAAKNFGRRPIIVKSLN